MRTMKVAVLAAVLGLTAVPGHAQQLAGTPAGQELLKQHCTGDYLAHCGEFAPGGPEVEACFRRKVRQLSPNCALAIGSYQREQGRVRKVSVSR